MKFNRHQLKQETLFGETIEKFQINRTNSTFNIEQRSLKSENFGFDITYVFTSRIWNQQMIQLLSSLNEYDIIVINSQIWDLSRYKDYSGELYMKNLDTFFSKISYMKSKIIWLSNAPINNSKDSNLSRVLSRTNPLTVSKAQQYDMHTLDLYAKMKDYMELLSNDGIHWTPQGQRMITKFLIDLLSHFPQQSNVQHRIQQPPLDEANNNISNNNNNSSGPSSKINFTNRRDFGTDTGIIHVLGDQSF
ncbi:unnamed protein product [Rotaria sp. Silwood2]|nr:unnamed protein product [Rotaria sp. Silwood2]